MRWTFSPGRLLGRTALALGSFLAAARAQQAEIEIHPGQILHPVSRYLTGACLEDVNHEIYGGLYSQMIFGESFQEPPPAGEAGQPAVSGCWRPTGRGSARGAYSVESQAVFIGRQSQRMAFLDGEGEIGLENRGLNRRGLFLRPGKPYEGYLCVRSAGAAALGETELFVALEDGGEPRILDEKRLVVTGRDWQKLEFKLTPVAAAARGRFVIKLKRPGAVVIGHAFLQPGSWGRFKGLPVRKDVAEGLIGQGITVLRYGGSMVNAKEYRWKNMIGPRDRRPPYHGTWYPFSSDGWGIPDFIRFCEAAGFLPIPAFNIDETPEDMADFVEYANGPADSPWGRRRAADGHPAPYRLSHVELGNEERVDEAYWRKFKPLAEAMWAKDPDLVLVVGDFSYSQPIVDRDRVTGAASGITRLTAQEKILGLAREHGREVWFDLHIVTQGPRPDETLAATLSFTDALARLAGGARYHVAVFELNATNHSQRRALANALAINALERDGRIPVVTSANCLQPDGQNDNGWDQGLLFLNPSRTWLQPPGYVTQMIANAYQPLLVRCEARSLGGALDASAQRSRDGRILVLQVVNPGDQPISAIIHLDGARFFHSPAEVEELAGPLDAENTAAAPDRIQPRSKTWACDFRSGGATYAFPAHSVTLIRLGPLPSGRERRRESP